MKQTQKTTNAWAVIGCVAGFCFVSGYLLGFLGKDVIFTSDTLRPEHASDAEPQNQELAAVLPAGKKWPGDTVHTLLTCDGGGYQNFQARIQYASYKLVQQMPGGEKMTGFTRILHRTVPDFLMEEIPTYHAWDLWHPECDTGCSFPVINRPKVIMGFFRAAAKDPSLIKGAWLLMTECDYVWMQPVTIPGNAYDPAATGEQYLFDYIMPQHPDAAPHIQKLYGPGKDINDVPASGPAPVMIRLEEWLIVGNDYERLSTEMESDFAIVKQLSWVREMYTWDVAVAMHPEVKIRLLKPPNSTLMVQPPFDLGIFNASFCHYTWGALFYEGKPSAGGKEVYRWEKRDFHSMENVIKPPHIPMPPPYRPGLFISFDQELTEPRYNLIVLYMTQLNKAIDTLPDLSDRAAKLDDQIAEFKKGAAERAAAKLKENIRYINWAPAVSPETR